MFFTIIRSQYVNGCDFEHEVVEYRRYNCFIPTKVYKVIKCIKFYPVKFTNNNNWILLDMKKEDVTL